MLGPSLRENCGMGASRNEGVQKRVPQTALYCIR